MSSEFPKRILLLLQEQVCCWRYGYPQRRTRQKSELLCSKLRDAPILRRLSCSLVIIRGTGEMVPFRRQEPHSRRFEELSSFATMAPCQGAIARPVNSRIAEIKSEIQCSLPKNSNSCIAHHRSESDSEAVSRRPFFCAKAEFIILLSPSPLHAAGAGGELRRLLLFRDASLTFREFGLLCSVEP